MGHVHVSQCACVLDVHVSQCACVLEFHFQHCAKQRHKMTAKKESRRGLMPLSTAILPHVLAMYHVFVLHPNKLLPERGYLTMYLTFRVAAEWVLRCGGGVKFKNPEKWIWDYNAIPDGPKGRLALEAINAKAISVTTGGLQHLGNYMLNCALQSFWWCDSLHVILSLKLPGFQVASIIVPLSILKAGNEM